jgi:hypothetical protein
MKRFSSIRILILTLTIIVAALPVAAVERAFASSGSGTVSFITDGAGNIIGADVTASGTATHLGLWTTTGKLTFTPDPNNPNIIHPSGAGAYIAANGDLLNFVIENADQDITTGIATGTFRFTGGTGRFAGATGSSSVVVTQNFITGAFQITSVGVVNY